ncbi:MAG: DUF1802 family protein [Planctomycetia bacterium]|nr:DUF1802 family protein [Planctomycetia bacterium]
MAEVTLGVALKEWDSIRAALRDGRQSLLLRKGGIHEPSGTFRVEHERFWIYPTFVHQGQESPVSEVTLDTLAEVVAIGQAGDLATVERLAGLHAWSTEAIAKRFFYRTPGLFVLIVRVYTTQPQLVTQTPAYAGCKSWVTLDSPVTERAVRSVLSDTAFMAMRQRIESAMNENRENTTHS